MNNRNKFPIKMATKVVFQDGVLVDAYIYQESEFKFILKTEQEKCLGEITLEIKEDHIFIKDMVKYSVKYRHVGTALHEFAFKESIRELKNGRIKLQAVGLSHLCHFSNGYHPVHLFNFRGQPQNESQHEKLRILCRAYQKDKTEINKQAILDYESQNSICYYELARLIALETLRLDKNSEISFDDIIEFGYFNNLTKVFETMVVECGKKRINTERFGSVYMYLPDDAIKQKRLQFGIKTSDANDEAKTEFPAKLHAGQVPFWSNKKIRKEHQRANSTLAYRR